jgi:hypothetical protein
MALALVALAVPAAARGAAPISITPVEHGIPLSAQVEADGNLWFGYVADDGGGALARVTPSGAIAYFPLPATTIGGVAYPSVPLALAAPPAGGPADRLFFTWAADPQNPDAGVGVTPFADPSQVQLWAASLPGDPLYSAALSGQFQDYNLLVTGPEVRLWSYADSTGSPPGALVASLRYPFEKQPAYVLAPYSVAQAPTGGSTVNLVAGSDGHVWFLDGNSASVGRVEGKRATEYPIGVTPLQIAAGADGNLWVNGASSTGSFGLSAVAYTGKVLATYPTPPGGVDFQWLAAGSDALWMPGVGSRYRVSFARLSYAGQWSWYAVKSPFGASVELNPTSVSVAPSGTIWEAYERISGAKKNGAHAFLAAYDASRIVTATPAQLSLASGASATVQVSEANYAGKYAATIGSISGQQCSLSVARVAAHSFEVTAGAALPAGCGVELSDAEGFATVWIPVSSSNAPLSAR